MVKTKQLVMLTEPWERQPRESEQAWAAFKHYRDAGALRSMRKTAAAVGKSYTMISRWSSRTKWFERVRAYDNEMDREVQAQMAVQARKAQQKHAQIGKGRRGLGLPCARRMPSRPPRGRCRCRDLKDRDL